ncbi:MAG: helix-turn-helix domain-containing protein [Caulobacteraceae bacterium]
MRRCAGDPIDRYIGGALRSWRKRKGLAQAAFGQMIGVSISQVQFYEKGENRVAASTLVRAAHALSLAPSDFLPERLELIENELSPSQTPPPDAARELIIACGKVTRERHRRALHVLVSALLEEETMPPEPNCD